MSETRILYPETQKNSSCGVCVCARAAVCVDFLGLTAYTHIRHNTYSAAHFAHGEMPVNMYRYLPHTHKDILHIIYYDCCIISSIYYIIICVWMHGQPAILNAKATETSAGKETRGECATLGRNDIVQYSLIIKLYDSSRVFNFSFGLYCHYSL